MAIHKKQHDFASNSDHIFTGLTNNEIIRLNSTGTAVESAGVTTGSFLNISGGTVTGQTIFSAGLSATTLSGGTILSGNTNLYSIFLTAGSLVPTYIQNGLNTYTGGTISNPTVNISGGSFNSIIASGSSTFLGGLSATTLSGGTILSGSTNLYSIFQSIGGDTEHTKVQNGLNTYTGGTTALPTVNISAATLSTLSVSGATSLATLSATTMISGSTNLYSIFQQIGSDTNHTNVQNGTNITTGGTAALPTVNLVASPSVNNITFSGTAIGGNVQANVGTFTSLSASTLSGGTILSGSTNLYNIFATNASIVHTNVQNGTNITTGGTAALPTINLVASPSINSLSFSGTAIGNAFSANTVSGGTILSGSTNLYNIFATVGSGVQTVNPGTNITIGGTPSNPTVNLVASPSVNGLSVSGTGNFTGTLQSGGTDLYSIFVDGAGTTNVLPLWSNTTGTLTDSIITQGATGVTVAGSVNIVGNVNVLGTASTFNTQVVQSLDNNILLNYSGTYITAIGGGITVLSGTPGGASSTWSTDANGAWSANTAILTSAITVNGGNIAVTGGGAMTSGGTNLYTIFATTGQDLTTASNGLTKSGYNVTLGGTLTAATTVGLGGNALQLSGEGASSTTVAWSGAPFYTRLTVNGSGSQLRSTFGTFGNNFFLASDSTTMNFTDGGAGTNMRMAFDGTNMYVTDAVNSRGLEYLQDYSPQFVANSLVTKLYVDSSITGVTSAITHTNVQPGSNITTGGTAALPTVNLVSSPSVNNLTASGNTSLQGTSGTTVYASQFFQMTPYTGSNPAVVNNNDAWFHSGATGTITLNYRVGGVTFGVELSS